MQENLKQKYQKILKLDENYKQEDIEEAYKKLVIELVKTPNLEKEQLIDQMLLINQASNYLTSYATYEKNVGISEKICNNLCLSYDEALKIYNKRKMINGQDEIFDDWLKRRSIFKVSFENFREEIISLYTDILQLLLIRYDRLVSMFETDCEFQSVKLNFKDWVIELIKIYQNNYKNGHKEFFLNDEYKEFISDINLGNNFLLYLREKTIELDLCQKLELDYYKEKEKFDLEKQNISFRKYLEDLMYIQDVMARHGVIDEQLNRFYNTYLDEGYTGKKIDFVKEFDVAIDYCFKLKKGYFVSKREYTELPDEKKPSTFLLWLEAETIAHKLGGYPKIIENIYLKQVNNGYTGTMEDLIIIYSKLK